MSKRGAIVQVDFDLVAHMLFGPQVKIHRVRPSFNIYGANIFDLLIEHPDLPEIKEGQAVSTKRVILHEENGKPPRVEFVDE